MRGAIPPLPQYVFMAWCLVKHRDNFTLTFSYFYQSFMAGYITETMVLEIILVIQIIIQCDSKVM
jgi:hypothetical protein